MAAYVENFSIIESFKGEVRRNEILRVLVVLNFMKTLLFTQSETEVANRRNKAGKWEITKNDSIDEM